MKPIFLVGFMGTGKTAVAKQLSKRLSLPLIDLDDKIEEDNKMKIVDIFSQHGEKYFRECERKALLEACNETNCIVSCGGGIVLDPQNVDSMEANGLAVCLDASPKVIHERTRHFDHRPLLNVIDPLKKITDLLAERKQYYNKIAFHVNTDEISLEQVSDMIIEHLELQV